jgi:hypothetical protein
LPVRKARSFGRGQAGSTGSPGHQHRRRQRRGGQEPHRHESGGRHRADRPGRGALRPRPRCGKPAPHAGGDPRQGWHRGSAVARRDDGRCSDGDQDPAAQAAGRGGRDRGRGEHHPRPEAAHHPQAARFEDRLRRRRCRRGGRLQRPRFLRTGAAADHRRHAASDVDARRVRLSQGRRLAHAETSRGPQHRGLDAGSGPVEQSRRSG